jgi:hypothetical protein
MSKLDGKARQATPLKICLVNRRPATVCRDELCIALSIYPNWANQLATQLVDRPRVAARTIELIVQHVESENRAIAVTCVGKCFKGITFTGCKRVQALPVQCLQALQLRGIENESLLKFRTYSRRISSLISPSNLPSHQC